MDTNYFKLFSVPFNATDEEIKKAFHKLAHIHHPDKGGNEDMFVLITKAKNTLLDKKEKQNYDIMFTNHQDKLLKELLIPNYIINNKKYVITNPEITGDGTLHNPFKEGKYKRFIFNKINIIQPIIIDK